VSRLLQRDLKCDRPDLVVMRHVQPGHHEQAVGRLPVDPVADDRPRFGQVQVGPERRDDRVGILRPGDLRVAGVPIVGAGETEQPVRGDQHLLIRLAVELERKPDRYDHTRVILAGQDGRATRRFDPGRVLRQHQVVHPLHHLALDHLLIGGQAGRAGGIRDLCAARARRRPPSGEQPVVGEDVGALAVVAQGEGSRARRIHHPGGDVRLVHRLGAIGAHHGAQGHVITVHDDESARGLVGGKPDGGRGAGPVQCGLGASEEGGFKIDPPVTAVTGQAGQALAGFVQGQTEIVAELFEHGPHVLMVERVGRAVRAAGRVPAVARVHHHGERSGGGAHGHPLGETDVVDEIPRVAALAVHKERAGIGEPADIGVVHLQAIGAVGVPQVVDDVRIVGVETGVDQRVG